MPPERQVYLLDPQELNPETIAVTFAKTSRSPESFREIASGLTDEKSAEFHEKWVVGYGHSSVAEHAVLHLAVENCSRLAVENLESNRLASYTEKSTRYQKWSSDDFFVPPELTGHPLHRTYLETCHFLLDTYRQSLNAVQNTVLDTFPRQPGESDSAWDRRTRTVYIDACRYLLPAACLANVGVTINARSLEHALVKMLSSPLEEVRMMGEEIKTVSRAALPTLIKYANPSPYLQHSEVAFQNEMERSGLGREEVEPGCHLVAFDSFGEDRVLAAALTLFGKFTYTQAFDFIKQAPSAFRQNVAHALLASLGEHDIPRRELEHCIFSFEIVLDQGAYFEFKRHRMMTQTPQPLTTRLGYAVPALIEQAGILPSYQDAMEKAAGTYEELAAFNPHLAAYVVPNAFNRRLFITLNLRSAAHFISLRTAPNAHFAMRRIARQMDEQMRQILPLLQGFLKPFPGETWQEVQSMHFSRLK